MCFAQFPTFYESLWMGIRPLADSVEFKKACATVLTRAEGAADSLPVSHLHPTLTNKGYNAADLTAIRAEIDIFHNGNMPYLLLAAIARHLLEGYEMTTSRAVTPRAPAPPAQGTLTLMEPHHADAPTQQVYEDIKSTLGLPIVNTDYRALARWPSYFAEAWGAIKPVLQSPDYEAQVVFVHELCLELAATLPNPGGLTAATLQNAAKQDAALDDVLSVVRMFQWLLPGLAVNVAMFRAQLGGHG